MIEREFKENIKSFIIWLSVLIIMFLAVYLVYPHFITDEAIKSMDELMKVFPPDVLKAFNMDMSSIETAYGWLKTEGFMFVLIIIGLYASILGGSILLKEENDKTIEYLSSLPIKRNQIMTNKIIISLTYIVLMTILLGIFNYIALLFSCEFEVKQFILLSITPIFIALPLFAINLYISTYMHKTKKVVGISMGMVFIFYVFNILSELSTKVEFMKYFSIYTLADTRNVINNIELNPWYITISFILTITFILLSYIRYNQKELV